MTRPAFCFVRRFEPAPARRLCVDRHYLLYASQGALRLEVDATSWTLPPARAALIRADEAIDVTIPQKVTTSSVLFDTDFAPPPANLSVIDMSPLARALVAECTRWGDEEAPLDEYALAMFRALAQATWALAADPSPVSMPNGRSEAVRLALTLTAKRLADEPKIGEIADQVGLASRSLARRFEQELGMTWRAALRRLRVLRAIELLAGTDHTATRIAVDVGYASLSAFESAFRNHVGKTPTDYRDGFNP